LATYIPPTLTSSQPFHHLNIYKHNYFSPPTTFEFELLKIELGWLALEQKQA
jgi:hypothetical protein